MSSADTPPDDNTVLPPPARPFGGTIGTYYSDSQPDIPDVLNAPEGAPNVLLIMLDDMGFGHSSTFGGPINTPTFQHLADEGLRYNRFHTTALCSPTRAALLTGRNHHSVHTGCIMELTSSYPGYDGELPKDAVVVAETLRQNGYNTAAFGKWHNTPDHETSTAGPFDHWPTGLGFEYFWGFMGGESNHWNTPLVENTTPVEQPADDPEWHFSEGMADQAISWINTQKASAPNKPFFCYFAPGAGHAPHHVTPEWADKYQGKFDHGWDAQREITFNRQKELGVIPADTQLTPRPDEIPAWDSCSPDEQRLYARMQEVFAGFVEHCDAQIGRVIDAVDKLDQKDNTLIIYIFGDNGPSAEGTLAGTLNNIKTQHGYPDDIATMLAHIDDIGGPKFENHYPVPWCWAGSSPLKWMKQVASHFGGTRNAMAMSWPSRIADTGGLREQFHHVIDIVPTILDVAGLRQPTRVNGVDQRPIEGVSMAYTWDAADAPSQRSTQYFEMMGNRAIYHEGWLAACRHGRLPWTTAGTVGFDDDTWELYHIDSDFSEAVDLVAENPDKLHELQQIFLAEADKYNVLPLDDRFVERADANTKPSHLRGLTRFIYVPPTQRIPESASPNTKNVSHTIAVEVQIPEGGADGVLVCCGGESAGYTLYLKNSRLCWEHNWFNESKYRVVSDSTITSGHHVLSVEVTVDEEHAFGGGGEAALRLGDTVIGEGRFDKQVGARFTVNESFDIGRDTITPVSEDYTSPFAFTGTLERVIVDVSATPFEELSDEAKEIHAKIAMVLQ